MRTQSGAPPCLSDSWANHMLGGPAAIPGMSSLLSRPGLVGLAAALRLVIQRNWQRVTRSLAQPGARVAAHGLSHVGEAAVPGMSSLPALFVAHG